MQSKNKQYQLLTVVVAPANFKDDLGDSCAKLITRAEYKHFNFNKYNGNVNETICSFRYQGNHGLMQQEYQGIERLMKYNFDAVNFLIPDPREILRNWRQWRDIFTALPNDIFQRSYVIPYIGYYKVEYISHALNVVTDIPSTNTSVSALPNTGIPVVDGDIWMFNQRCNYADIDLLPSGFVRPVL